MEPPEESELVSRFNEQHALLRLLKHKRDALEKLSDEKEQLQNRCKEYEAQQRGEPFVDSGSSRHIESVQRLKNELETERQLFRQLQQQNQEFQAATTSRFHQSEVLQKELDRTLEQLNRERFVTRNLANQNALLLSEQHVSDNETFATRTAAVQLAQLTNENHTLRSELWQVKQELASEKQIQAIKPLGSSPAQGSAVLIVRLQEQLTALKIQHENTLQLLDQRTKEVGEKNIEITRVRQEANKWEKKWVTERIELAEMLSEVGTEAEKLAKQRDAKEEENVELRQQLQQQLTAEVHTQHQEQQCAAILQTKEELIGGLKTQVDNLREQLMRLRKNSDQLLEQRKLHLALSQKEVARNLQQQEQGRRLQTAKSELERQQRWQQQLRQKQRQLYDQEAAFYRQQQQQLHVLAQHQQQKEHQKKIDNGNNLQHKTLLLPAEEFFSPHQQRHQTRPQTERRSTTSSKFLFRKDFKWARTPAAQLRSNLRGLNSQLIDEVKPDLRTTGEKAEDQFSERVQMKPPQKHNAEFEAISSLDNSANLTLPFPTLHLSHLDSPHSSALSSQSSSTIPTPPLTSRKVQRPSDREFSFATDSSSSPAPLFSLAEDSDYAPDSGTGEHAVSLSPNSAAPAEAAASAGKFAAKSCMAKPANLVPPAARGSDLNDFARNLAPQNCHPGTESAVSCPAESTNSRERVIQTFVAYDAANSPMARAAEIPAIRTPPPNNVQSSRSICQDQLEAAALLARAAGVRARVTATRNQW